VPESGDVAQSEERGCCSIHHPPAPLVSSIRRTETAHTDAQLAVALYTTRNNGSKRATRKQGSCQNAVCRGGGGCVYMVS